MAGPFWHAIVISSFIKISNVFKAGSRFTAKFAPILGVEKYCGWIYDFGLGGRVSASKSADLCAFITQQSV